MKVKHYTILIISLITLALIFGFGIINTMVSLKYETNFDNECVSTISGDNLCNSLRNIKYLFYIDLIAIFILLLLQGKIIKKTDSD